MRKRKQKKKGHGCWLCKPWKYARMGKWKPKDKAKLEEFEKEKHTAG